MRTLKLQMHITIDGFVAGPDGQLDWFVEYEPRLPREIVAACSDAKPASACQEAVRARAS